MMFASDQNVVVQMLGPQLWGFLSAAPPPQNIATGYSDGASPSPVEFVLTKPDGSTVAFTFGSPPPEILTLSTDGSGYFRIQVDKSAYNLPGTYSIVASVDSPPDQNYSRSISTWQWGGVADDIQITRKWLTNRIEPDFSIPAAPTLTLYDDNNSTVLATRTATNANNSAVSESQIMRLTKLA